MYYMKYYFIGLFLLSCNLEAGADTGCKLPNGKIYGPQTGTALLGATLVPLNLGILVPLYNSPEISQIPGACPGYANTPVSLGTPCTTSALTILGLGLVAQNEGVEFSYSFVNCNLDDYTWTLGAAAGLFGIFVIKRKNKL